MRREIRTALLRNVGNACSGLPLPSIPTHLCGFCSVWGTLVALQRLEPPTRGQATPSRDCQLSDLQAGAVRSSLHRRCLFHSPSKVVSLQDKLLIWEIAMTGKANVKGLSLDALGASNGASSADTAPAGTSSPRRNSPKQTIRRPELRKIVPLADTTIYEMEQRGEFPRRFHLTSRCVVWDLAEVEAWVEERRRASDAAMIKRAPSPDVRQRKTRPVRH